MTQIPPIGNVVIALHTQMRDDVWRQQLLEYLPTSEIRTWPDWGDSEDVDYAIVWELPVGFLQKYQNLKTIFGIGAGIDGILADPDFPTDVPLVRMIDKSLESGMAEYVTMAVLAIHRDMHIYLAHQVEKKWKAVPQTFTKDRTVGLMGFGRLGYSVFKALSPFGFRFSAWSLSRKDIPGVETYAGPSELAAFLSSVEILVVVLPLTDQTRGLLHAQTLAYLPKGAAVVNVARGSILKMDDAKILLDRDHLSCLWLDVQEVEPLPKDHWAWICEKVIVTPHVAATVSLDTAVFKVAQSISDVENGEAPGQGVVDITRGY